MSSLTKRGVEKPPTIDNCMNIAIIRLSAVGAYGGTPGRNALRPYGSWAGYRKIITFFLL